NDTQFVDKSPAVTPAILVSTRPQPAAPADARVGVYRSTDGGETWIRASDTDAAVTVSGLKPGNVTDLVAVRNPDDPTKPAILFPAHTGGGNYADAGIYKSVNQGLTWAKVTAAFPDPKAGGNYDFPASKPDRIRFAVQALDKGSKTITNLYVGVIPAENT